MGTITIGEDQLAAVLNDIFKRRGRIGMRSYSVNLAHAIFARVHEITDEVVLDYLGIEPL